MNSVSRPLTAWLKIFLGCSVLALLLQFREHYPHAMIDFGQLSKQNHDLSFARSFYRGEVQGIFPIRHFLEIYHQDSIPWTAEFPLYVLLVSVLTKGTSLLMPIQAGHETVILLMWGRVLNLVAYLTLLLGIQHFVTEVFSREKAFLQKLALPLNPQGVGMLATLLVSLFPAFRLYACTFMPDLWMTALVVWGLYFFLRERFAFSAGLLMLSALMKYYSVFYIFSLLTYTFFQKGCTHQKKWRIYSLYILAALPAFLYVISFVILKIPNPITDYMSIGHAGHFSSSQTLFTFAFYRRLFTWLFIKNTTPLSLVFLLFFALFSFILPRRFPHPSLHPPLNSYLNQDFWTLLGHLFLGQILFMAIFASGHYIHDYYSLPTLITLMFPLLLGLLYFLHWCQLRFSSLFTQRFCGFVIFLLFFTLSTKQVDSATTIQNYFQELVSVMQENSGQQDKFLVMGDRATEIPLVWSERKGWMIVTHDLQKFAPEQLLLELQKKSVQKILLYRVDEDSFDVFLPLLTSWMNSSGQNMQLLTSGRVLSRRPKVPSVYYRLYQVTPLTSGSLSPKNGL